MTIPRYSRILTKSSEQLQFRKYFCRTHISVLEHCLMAASAMFVIQNFWGLYHHFVLCLLPIIANKGAVTLCKFYNFRETVGVGVLKCLILRDVFFKQPLYSRNTTKYKKVFFSYLFFIGTSYSFQSISFFKIWLAPILNMHKKLTLYPLSGNKYLRNKMFFVCTKLNTCQKFMRIR